MKRFNQFWMITVILGFFSFGADARGETLREVIDEVIRTNPQVRSQVYNRLAVDQELRQARSGYYPRLDLTAGAGVSEHREPESETLNPREAAIRLTQNLFEGFGTKYSVDRQRSRGDASAYKLQGTSEALALEACRAYLDVLRTQELKEVAQKNLDTHLRIMEQIKQRSDSGVGSRADTDQVSGRLALARSNLVIAETNVMDAASTFLAVVGRMPGDLVKPAAPDSEIPTTREDAVALAIAENPLLKSAAAELEARKKEYEVVKAPYYPSLDLVVEQRWDEEISRVEEERNETSAMVKLSYNIFGGFRDQGRKMEKLERISEAKEIKNNTERRIVAAMQLSWRAYRSNTERIDLLSQRIVSSDATARAYAQQFDIGRRTLLDVLNTEAESINARADLIDAEYDGLIAQYRLLQGIGVLVHHFDLEWPEESIVSEE